MGPTKWVRQCLGLFLGGAIAKVVGQRKVLRQAGTGGAPGHARHSARNATEAGQK